MIAYLRGTLAERGADHVVIDVGGVGYLAHVSRATLAALPAQGERVLLHVHTHATQDGPFELFGFAAADERELFRRLLDVQGVGPRVAQGMLSGMDPGELARAIAAGDAPRLRRLKGVGPRLAERIVVELRDKVTPPAAGPGAPPLAAAAPPSVRDEVVRSLQALGFKLAEAEKAVAAAAAKAPDASADRLLREALAASRGT